MGANKKLINNFFHTDKIIVKLAEMTDSFLIEVECHSGYKADEYPKCFYWYEKKYEIKEILDRWYQGDLNPQFPSANYYKILTTSEKQFIIKHETKSDKWYLVG